MEPRHAPARSGVRRGRPTPRAPQPLLWEPVQIRRRRKRSSRGVHPPPEARRSGAARLCVGPRGGRRARGGGGRRRHGREGRASAARKGRAFLRVRWGRTRCRCQQRRACGGACEAQARIAPFPHPWGYMSHFVRAECVGLHAIQAAMEMRWRNAERDGVQGIAAYFCIWSTTALVLVENSIMTAGSGPSTIGMCPGGMWYASPAFTTSSVPSSYFTFMTPDFK
mmetsp:Transcript_8329/g.27682  ORF Transcript_8329/g.27682 Transcript_8329/m.27682 type:complete len:224 (+) Transcript_8329:152-823(+)